MPSVPKPKHKKQARRFAKRRHPEYRAFVRSQPCILTHRFTTRQLCPYDIQWESQGKLVACWSHVCWGPIDPAHVGDKQSQGAYDVGRVVPLCRAGHRFYDEHRSQWRNATEYSEADMESAAAGYALKFVERGGTL